MRDTDDVSKGEERFRLLAETVARLLESADPQGAVEELCRQILKQGFDILQGISRIFREALACETEEEVGRICLKVAEEVTGSKFGFIAELGPGGLLDIAVSDSGREACRMAEQTGHRTAPGGLHSHGLYGRILLDGKGLIANEPASHPDSIGTPEGHPPLRAFMGAPLRQNGKTVGMIAVGNRDGGYGPEDLAAFEVLAEPIVQVVMRRRAEKALQKERDLAAAAEASVKYQALLLGQVQDGIIGSDAETRITYWNTGAERIFGFTEEEALGKTSLELLRPTYAPGERERILDELARRGAAEATIRTQHKSGKEVIAEVNSTRMTDESGRTTGYVVVYREVTEREAVSNELRRTRAHLENLLDYANAPIIVWDPSFKITRFNHAFERLTGLKADEVIGRPLDILFPEETREASLEHIKRTLAGERWEVVEIPILRTDGMVRTVLWNSANVCEENGITITATIAQGQDITDRKEAEEEAKWLASFPVLNPLPVVELDSSGRICFSNPAAQALFPDLRDIGTGHPWMTEWSSLAESVLKGHAGQLSREVSVGERWFQQSMYFVPETHRLRIYGTEITPLKRAENELRQQSEELRRLNRTLTALSHSNQALMRARSEEEFLTDACRIIIRDCGHAMVWIGYAEEDAARSVRPMAFAGYEDGYVESMKISWDDVERGRGPTGSAIRTSKPCFCQNLKTDAKFEPWREAALARGYASSLVLPLLTEGRAIGAISIFFKDKGDLSVDEQGLLTELASDMAYGITSIRLREAHARAEEDLKTRSQELQKLTETLEQRVQERTFELAQANELLRAEISHSHIIEADLDQQRETLQTLVDNIPVMLCIFDPSGQAKLTNREFDRLLGWPKEEAGNLEIAPARAKKKAAIPPTDISASEGIPGWQEHVLKTHDGADLESSWATVRLSDGGQIGIGLDMRERRAAEEERLRLAAAVAQAKEAMAITDAAGHIIYVNPAFEKTSGLGRAELLGKSYYDLLAGEDADQSLGRQARKIVSGGEAWNAHLIRKLRGELTSELDIRISPIRDRSGNIINYLVIERDITHEVRLREHLKQAQKMEALGTLAGGIAHDINNILNPIFINTELVLMDAALDQVARRDLETVLKAAERGRDLVKQIITFSRQKEKERRPSKVGPVIKEALKFLRSSLPVTIEIRQRIEPETGYIMADPSQIHQVVMNLCNNAAYAMQPQGGVLDVSLVEVEVDKEMALRHPDLKPGHYLRLTVGDTGMGMPPEVMERAFDPFFTTKKRGEGSGMGLALVHGIVKDYDGAVTLYSEVGKGTTFNIFFPRTAAAEVRPEGAEEGLLKGTERILLVDDEKSQAQSIRNILRRLGYQVLVKTDAELALAAFRKDPGRFDLIITDQTMPKLTGVQLAARLLELRPGLPILLCTGFSEHVDADGARAMGIRGFLMKPFSIREMARAVKAALGKPASG
jgi:PAS domain S-box-containing protein